MLSAGLPDIARPRLWGLKVVATAAILGPLVTALTMIGLMIVYSVGIARLPEPGVWPNVLGVSQLILFVSYAVITPHVLFFGLAGYVMYLLRHRIAPHLAWRWSQNLLLIYVGGCLIFINNHDPRAQLMQRIAIAVALLVGTGAVWLATRRWHSPAPARR